VKKLLLLVIIIVLAQSASAEFQQMNAADFRNALQECKDFENSLNKNAPACSFTDAELANTNGDPSIEQKNEENITHMAKCMTLNFHAEELFKNGEITEQEYNDAIGNGDYEFGDIGNGLLSRCAYGDCVAMVNYYYKSARAATDFGRKIELYDKAFELYMKCMELSTSELINPADFPDHLGGLGEDGGPLNKIASDAHIERCNVKILMIEQKIASALGSGASGEEIADLYEELQKEIVACSELSFSLLVDPGSDFVYRTSILSYSARDERGTYAHAFKDAFINKCEYRLNGLREKIAGAADEAKRQSLLKEFAAAYLECFGESDYLLGGYDDVNPFNFFPANDAEYDAIIKSCSERIDELEAEKSTPFDRRKSGYSDYGIDLAVARLKQECGLTEETPEIPDAQPQRQQSVQDIIGLAPERFSDNAGVYTIDEGDKQNISDSASQIFSSGNFSSDSAPSPGTFVSINSNAGLLVSQIKAGKDSVENAIKDFVPTQAEQAPEPEEEPEDNVSACDESACGEWGEWSWDYCLPEGKQTATRTRSCTDANNCGTDLSASEKETKDRGCTFTPPDANVFVNGKPVSTLKDADKNAEVIIQYADRAINYPITVKLTSPILTGVPVEMPISDPWETCEDRARKCRLDISDWVVRLVPTSSTGFTSATLLVVGGTSLKKFTEIKLNLGGVSTCDETWSCGSWSSCSSGSQSRTCTDSSNCGTTQNKPATSQACESAPSCTESWSCGEWSAWGSWGSCSEAGSQSRTRTKSCTDANNCGTTSSKPSTSESESQSCSYTPTEQKAEYSAHESALGSNIGTMNYSGDSKSFNLSSTGGTYGYKILSIPSGATIKICVAASGGVAYNAYPQYHYGYDWSSAEWEAANPGCITAYNKNAWANGMLLHLGDPTPASVSGTVTVSQIS